MFQYKTVIDQVAQFSKQGLSYIKDEDFRKSLEAVVDANTKFSKTVYDTTLDLSKQAVEKAKEFDYSKPFAELAQEFLVK
jgi:hypothetical protein